MKPKLPRVPVPKPSRVITPKPLRKPKHKRREREMDYGEWVQRLWGGQFD